MIKGMKELEKLKVFIDLKETVTFDNIQRCFRITNCLVVVCEIYNIIVILANARVLCSTLTILQRERSSSLKVQVESTALLAQKSFESLQAGGIFVFCLVWLELLVWCYKYLRRRVNRVALFEFSIVIIILSTSLVLSICCPCNFMFK